MMEIPEEEQRRLIAESELFKSAPSTRNDEESTFGDEVFNAVILIIPFVSLFLMMDMCVILHLGYSPF
jgi:hypothetical protein